MTKTEPKSEAACEIAWDEITQPEWESYFRQIPRSTLLQCRDYGDAMARLNHQRVRRGVITIAEETAGLVQVLEAGVFRNAVQGVILDRGPLWFEGFGGVQDCAQFIRHFRQDYPKRFGRRVRFLPEMPVSDVLAEEMQRAQLIKKGVQGYRTIWLDLRPDIEVLKKNLEKNWRGSLRKAQADAGMQIVWDTKGVYLDWLLAQYAADKSAKAYDGAAPVTIRALASAFVRGENMLIGAALVDNRPVAAILIFIHGSSATYQVGYTSALGRERCAHHGLLWKAVEVLKERCVHDFDLGGIHDEGAQGVTAFKRGMGGAVFETLGLFA